MGRQRVGVTARSFLSNAARHTSSKDLSGCTLSCDEAPVAHMSPRDGSRLLYGLWIQLLAPKVLLIPAGAASDVTRQADTIGQHLGSPSVYARLTASVVATAREGGPLSFDCSSRWAVSSISEIAAGERIAYNHRGMPLQLTCWCRFLSKDRCHQSTVAAVEIASLGS